MELDIDDVPWEDNPVAEPPEIIDGYMTIPRTPGWGTETTETDGLPSSLYRVLFERAIQPEFRR